MKMNWPIISVLCALCCGCNVVGMVAYVFAPPEKIPAKYTPAKQHLAVVVENYKSPSADYLEAEQLALALHDQLAAHDVTPLIDPGAVDKLRDADPVGFQKLSIGQIGQKVGAKQVLYVQINHANYEVAGGSDLFKTTVTAQVKVVDADTGNTLWPMDAANGYPIKKETSFQAQGQVAPDATLRVKLCQELATQIAYLFYQREVER